MTRLGHGVAMMTFGVLAALLTASCSSPASSDSNGDGRKGAEAVYAEFDAMDDDERMNELVKAAEAEGRVVIQLRAEAVDEELKKAFEAKYDIEMEIQNPGRPAGVRQQVLEEKSAGQVQSDVIETYLTELNIVFVDEDVITKIPDFLKKDVIKPGMASTYALETLQYASVAAWNTEKIKGSDVPTSYADFKNPVWKDKLVLTQDYMMDYKNAFEYLKAEGMTTAEFEDLFSYIGKNASITDSCTPAIGFLASGQYWGGPFTAINCLKRQPEIPVEWDTQGLPVLLNPLGIGLVKDAQHPAAAMLWSHWYVTEGQKILQKEMYVNQSPDETDLKGALTKTLGLDDLDAETYEAWRAAYDNMVKGKAGVLPDYIKAG